MKVREQRRKDGEEEGEKEEEVPINWTSVSWRKMEWQAWWVSTRWAAAGELRRRAYGHNGGIQRRLRWTKDLRRCTEKSISSLQAATMASELGCAQLHPKREARIVYVLAICPTFPEAFAAAFGVNFAFKVYIYRQFYFMKPLQYTLFPIVPNTASVSARGQPANQILCICEP